jgi:hypothetical protein
VAQTHSGRPAYLHWWCYPTGMASSPDLALLPDSHQVLRFYPEDQRTVPM